MRSKKRSYPTYKASGLKWLDPCYLDDIPVEKHEPIVLNVDLPLLCRQELEAYNRLRFGQANQLEHF